MGDIDTCVHTHSKITHNMLAFSLVNVFKYEIIFKGLFVNSTNDTPRHDLYYKILYIRVMCFRYFKLIERAGTSSYICTTSHCNFSYTLEVYRFIV